MVILEIGSKTKKMEKAHIFIRMDKNIKDNGQKIKNLDKETIIIKMGTSIKVTHFILCRWLER
jgi:hypothetical protein